MSEPIVTLNLKIQLPENLLGEVLQHIRNFDVKHFEHVILSMWVDAPKTKAERIRAIMDSIRPPYAINLNIPLKHGD